jgi:hypothetical protein
MRKTQKEIDHTRNKTHPRSFASSTIMNNSREPAKEQPEIQRVIIIAEICSRINMRRFSYPPTIIRVWVWEIPSRSMKRQLIF